MKLLFKLASYFFVAGLFFISCNSSEKKPATLASHDSSDKKWWKEAILYQLYPRSFKDSDGDGIGDIKGFISKLDYIRSLGVTAVWLNPNYSSPNDDNGYDVSDYRGIMKDFGTMEDFNELLKAMHERNIKLVMDVVVNHSSDEHEWVRQSRSSRTNPYRDYYHCWNAERGQPQYRYSLFDVNHDAYTRELEGKKFLVLLNFTAKDATVKTGIDISKGKVLINNYGATSATEKLKPYEAIVIEL